MALLCCSTAATKCLAIVCGEYIAIGRETAAAGDQEEAYSRLSDAASPQPTAEVVHVSIDDSPVTCMTFSPSGELLAACSDDKKLKIWKTGNWTTVGERELPKRATAVEFTRDEQWVVVADKTGEVFKYQTDKCSDSGVHLLGHFSIVLDMVLSPSNSHVITCDRDEKIRVSNFPNSYNIESFCLGHTDFVSKVCLCETWPQILLSASGDGTLRVWQWQTGTLLDTLVLSPPSPDGGDSKDPLAVTSVCCLRSKQPVIVASTESYCRALSFEFDWSDRLWVCLSDEHSQPLVCYEWLTNKFKKVATSELLHNLCKSEHLSKTGKPRDWAEMRKHVMDNMAAYFTRKEERIKQKLESKRPASEHHSPGGDGGDGDGGSGLTLQPAKLVKLESSSSVS